MADVSRASPGQKPSLAQSHSFRIASTAGTYADAEHVQTADDAVDEAEKVFNQKHHEFAPAFTEAPMGAIATCLNSSRFESILSMVICLNMILIIAETDLTADGQEPPVWITTANVTFLAVYFVECVLKICVFRWSYFQETPKHVLLVFQYTIYHSYIALDSQRSEEWSKVTQIAGYWFCMFLLADGKPFVCFHFFWGGVQRGGRGVGGEQITFCSVRWQLAKSS